MYAVNTLYSIQFFQPYALEQKYLLEERPEKRLSGFAGADRMIQGNTHIKINSQKHSTSVTART